MCNNYACTNNYAHINNYVCVNNYARTNNYACTKKLCVGEKKFLCGRKKIFVWQKKNFFLYCVVVVQGGSGVCEETRQRRDSGWCAVEIVHSQDVR
jgi:hypothetical protein